MDSTDGVLRMVNGVAACASRGLETFGSERHGFVLTPVPEAEIVGFESAHGVRLPDDFRAFLLRAIRAAPSTGR